MGGISHTIFFKRSNLIYEKGLPCIKELPSLKKIEQQYDGKKIEFLRSMIDTKEDYENWKKMVDENN